jgi:hypothetical protein
VPSKLNQVFDLVLGVQEVLAVPDGAWYTGPACRHVMRPTLVAVTRTWDFGDAQGPGRQWYPRPLMAWCLERAKSDQAEWLQPRREWTMPRDKGEPAETPPETLTWLHLSDLHPRHHTNQRC